MADTAALNDLAVVVQRRAAQRNKKAFHGKNLLRREGAEGNESGWMSEEGGSKYTIIGVVITSAT